MELNANRLSDTLMIILIVMRILLIVFSGLALAALHYDKTRLLIPYMIFGVIPTLAKN